jgi:hypothetical protein
MELDASSYVRGITGIIGPVRAFNNVYVKPARPLEHLLLLYRIAERKITAIHAKSIAKTMAEEMTGLATIL